MKVPLTVLGCIVGQWLNTSILEGSSQLNPFFLTEWGNTGNQLLLIIIPTFFRPGGGPGGPIGKQSPDEDKAALPKDGDGTCGCPL
jgi:hypothetical protein